MIINLRIEIVCQPIAHLHFTNGEKYVHDWRRKTKGFENERRCVRLGWFYLITCRTTMPSDTEILY